MITRRSGRRAWAAPRGCRSVEPVSDSFSKLDARTVARAARAAVEGVLVTLIALQGAAAAAIAVMLGGEMLELSSSERWSGVAAGVGVVAGALGAPFVAGWWVLGGWRGGQRAVAVVLVAGAAGGGTFASPILGDRLRSDELVVAAVLAGFGAAATSGVAFTVIAARPRRAPGSEADVPHGRDEPPTEPPAP